MRKFIGLLLQILGWTLFGWTLMTGLLLSGAYLMGYIGTKGREAGQYLPYALGYTVIMPLLGYGIVRLGRRVMGRAAQSL
jgi:hypothetical protein